MKYLKRFKIFEADISDTYLDIATNKQSSIQKEISLAKKLYGNLFAEAPSTTDKSWGIEFEMLKDYDNSIDYKVKFTDEFFKNFIKTNADSDSWWEKFLSVFGIGDVSFRSLKKCVINCERFLYSDHNFEIDTSKSCFNRIHFAGGIPEEFRGINLGYIIYEAFIKYLGYASSTNNASNEAKRVWSKIAEDPDFYCIISRKRGHHNDLSGSILAVHKDCQEDLTKVIIDWITRESSLVNSIMITDDKTTTQGFLGFKIDPNLLKKYKDIEPLFLEIEENSKKKTIEQEELVKKIQSFKQTLA